MKKKWHAFAVKEALEELNSGEDGLSEKEASRRREKFGINKLPEKKRAGLFKIIFRQMKDPLVYILLIAGAVSLGIGNFNNALFIFAVLFFNTSIGTFQEYKAETSAKALQSVMKVRVDVVRSGKKRRMDSENLVPGDIVIVKSGSSVPADIRLLDSKDLRADESLLTGESVPVEKYADEILEEDTSLGDRSNIIHAGTSIMSGRGKGLVCRTGTETEVGRIAESLTEESQQPPLVVKLNKFTRQIGIIVLAAVSILGVVQFTRGVEITEIFFLGVALSVSAIPAGLPVAITVAMAIASNRMAKRNVIVRQLPAVEGLGSCTLIASDKTGTLTANKLTIKRLRGVNGSEFEVTGSGYDPDGRIIKDNGEIDDDTLIKWRRFAESGALSNEAEFEVKDGGEEHQGDTVDVAFLVLAEKMGVSRNSLLSRYPEISFIPFESERRYSASFNRHDDEVIAHVKGAAETLEKMCSDITEEDVELSEDELGGKGYRMLAVARGKVPDKKEYGEEDLKDLEFLGFAGLIDPIRDEVAEAVRRCRSAGVDVRMITGDHPATGMSIARKIKIAGKEDISLTGTELEKMEEDETKRERIKKAPVFARIEPTQKTDIVNNLQDQDHFVAVTGDGVNDAPALRSAHIGVSMGEGGTDVARGASDMILTDDNFASIVNGIEEGRIAYDNVRKVTWLLLSTGAAEVLLFFLSLFVGLPLPLTAIQLLWLNLVTNGIQDVALAFEKGEPDILKRKPRPPGQPIFDRQMIRQTMLSGFYIGIVAFITYYYLHQYTDLSDFQARNLLLLLMVLFENMHAFSCRSETRSIFRIPLRSNPLLIISVVAAQSVHIISMFIPGMNTVLETQPVSFSTWLLLLMVASSLLVFDEMAKFFHRRSSGKRKSRSAPK